MTHGIPCHVEGGGAAEFCPLSVVFASCPVSLGKYYRMGWWFGGGKKEKLILPEGLTVLVAKVFSGKRLWTKVLEDAEAQWETAREELHVLPTVNMCRTVWFHLCSSLPHTPHNFQANANQRLTLNTPLDRGCKSKYQQRELGFSVFCHSGSNPRQLLCHWAARELWSLFLTEW